MKERIRELNDLARAGSIAATWIVTAGIAALHVLDQAKIVERVRQFDDFTPDNDPHGEHDFGSFEFNGEKIFYKIDYFDQDCLMGSEDPSDPTKTTRVITVMFAHEY